MDVESGGSPLHELLDLSDGIFNLIRDYPASLSSLARLRDLLDSTFEYEHVIEVMKTQIESRLLIPGAHTEDILQMYLRTYKVISLLFKHVASSYSEYRRIDVFMRVTKSVIEHLHKRSDSVKCIVSALLDEGLLDDDEGADPSPVGDDLPPDEWGLDWTPPPLEGGGKGQDTMSLLIGVYGGKEYFLSEYRTMLASRLLSVGSFDIDREVASLDLMKLKFDAESLGDCSVMIGDVMESKSVFLKIRNKLSQRRKLNMLSALVLSKHFWPLLKDDDATDSIDQFTFFPPELTALMREYEQLFTELKPTQRLLWRKDQGVVSISVELRNRSLEFRVSPEQVQVLACFVGNLTVPQSAAATPVVFAVVPEPTSLSPEEIAFRTKLPPERARTAVQFWVARGVLREIQINRFVINE